MNQPDQRFVARPDVVDCDIGGDRALLNMQSNTYFTVNPTAAEIWLALKAPKSVDDLVGVVTDAFDVTEDRCRPDVETVLADMLAAGIVEKAATDAGG
jgi:hypothetical protein